MTRILNFLILPLMALGLAACGINSVPAAEEEAKAKWADVEAAYQRRIDLIPNLVSTVQAAAESERAILTEVTEARARATSIQVDPENLDAESISAFAEAQGELGAGLGRLLASFEAYPQIQSNANFRDLQSQLEGTENRIAIARRDYNEAVRQYNTTIRTFPDTIGANLIHGAEPMAPFSATTEGAEEAPDVDFGA